MNKDLEELEENLKQKQKPKKKDHKISGRSVFKLQQIIQAKAVLSEVERKKKAKKDIDRENSKQDSDLKQKTTS